MKTSRILPAMLAVTLLLPFSVHAGGRAPAKKKVVVPVHTVISTVSDTSITTSTNSSDGKNHKTLTYTITPETKVEVKGAKATVKDLQTGMRVSVTVGRTADVAARISAGDAPTR